MMSLVQSTLRSAIARAAAEALQIDSVEPGSPPNIPKKVAKLYASAYHQYALAATAGVLKFVSIPSLDTLSEALTAPSFSGWGVGLSAYWSPVVWTAPGFIPSNPTQAASLSALASSIDSQIVDILSAPQPTDKFVSRLAAALHSSTILLQVLSTTTSVPPVVASLPVA